MSRSRRTRTASKGAGSQTSGWQSECSSRIRPFRSECRPSSSDSEVTVHIHSWVSGRGSRNSGGSYQSCKGSSRGSHGTLSCKASGSSSSNSCSSSSNGQGYCWRSWRGRCRTGRGSSCCTNNHTGSRCSSCTSRCRTRWHRTSSRGWTSRATR